MLSAAKRYELPERQKGERCGPLGSVATDVLEYFVKLIDFRTGRLEPSIETVMGKTPWCGRSWLGMGGKSPPGGRRIQGEELARKSRN
ncbi:MAG: hypothetical protein AAAC48_02090 [Phyllobacterium sp.]